MNNFLEEITAFLFGKGLKVVLFIIGILSFISYTNHRTQFGFAITAGAFVFTAVYLSVHERKDKH